MKTYLQTLGVATVTMCTAGEGLSICEVIDIMPEYMFVVETDICSMTTTPRRVLVLYKEMAEEKEKRGEARTSYCGT